MKIDLFYNELTLLVLLTVFISPRICPPDHVLAPFTKDIINTMKSRNQESILWRTDPDVNTVVKKIGASCN